MLCCAALVILFLSVPIFPASASPSIDLSPRVGQEGTVVDVSGSGFFPLSIISISFDGEEVATNPDNIVADGAGRFSASFQVPRDVDPGAKLVTADGTGIMRSSASSTFRVTADVVDNPPVARAMSLLTYEDIKLDILLDAGDSDRKNISFVIVDNPRNGVLGELQSATGAVSYEPARNYNGRDSFTFKVRDEKYESRVATVSINVIAVNDKPEMGNVSTETEEDTEIKIALVASDLDSSLLSFTIVTKPQHGNLGGITSTGNYSAEVTFVPDLDYNGDDFFAFKASDGEDDSDIAEAEVKVKPINDPPVARGAEIWTVQNRPVSFSLIGSDADGDGLSYSIVQVPSHGTLSGTAPNLVYTPSLDYRGIDKLSFKVTDGSSESGIAPVLIPVLAASRDGSSGEANEPDLPSRNESQSPDSGAAGNATTVDSAASNVTGTGIPDGNEPELIVPTSRIHVSTTSEFGANVQFNVSAFDEQDGNIIPYCSPKSGALFPVGEVNVTCEASDSAGNTALKSFVVTVELAAKEDDELMPPFVIPSVVTGIIGAAAYGGFKVVRRAR